MAAPDEIKYTEEHEWVQRTGDDTVRIGITEYAQQQLGDVVFVQLPEPGQQVTSGESMGEVESTKSVSEIYAPVSGEVMARNEQLEDEPELVNSAPLGGGWMVELKLADPAQLDALLDAQAYQKLTES
ncbi:glycine cleavage system protein GcvH [Saccharopolyspora sp. ASAGF58]|uniref:glycine cleavage system protein GcvH n=1 Tax=Saccharopolyspora sp. ASAGF58 TaxID=2719023 RepID=UPI00143FE724|nr:glycine cleavage system protein GcvH [Saccharopolyspora sp. ASAGF58]QIZ38909.1 glycine cleavage system protein GcvH [Saccharopolyspora sp. ASAGF58]